MSELEYLAQRIERKRAARSRRIDTRWIADDEAYAAALRLGREVEARVYEPAPAYRH